MASGRVEPLVPGKYDVKFLVCMEEAQAEEIRADCDKLGISRNEYMRRAAYSYMEKLDQGGDF